MLDHLGIQEVEDGLLDGVAARLCGLARAGEVLASEDMVRPLDGGFALEGFPPVEVKGRAQPVRLCRLLAES